MPNASDTQLASLLARNTVYAASAVHPTAPQAFVGLIVEYVGAQASCLLTTTGGNSLASAIGAAGSEAADPNFTIGSTSGTIDMTQTTANTMQKIVNFINGLGDYRCRLVGLRYADTSTTTGYLLAVSNQQAKVPGVGYAFAVDTANALNITCEISCLEGAMYSGGSVPTGTASASERSVNVRMMGGLNGDYKRDAINTLYSVDETLTYTGAGTFAVYAVNDLLQTDRLLYTGTILEWDILIPGPVGFRPEPFWWFG